ncbi:unnamed protein product [Toxocara canis]|uniref:Uncharacterized protein n=1 Tax=Toxocara canis TaxID=6265 RepID=A0A183V803_TOXCA|nr:unnamed protein product [Toxocara canis]
MVFDSLISCRLTKVIPRLYVSLVSRNRLTIDILRRTTRRRSDGGGFGDVRGCGDGGCFGDGGGFCDAAGFGTVAAAAVAQAAPIPEVDLFLEEQR